MHDEVGVADNGSLIVWRVGLEDEGQYTCTANNGVGQPISKTVQLKINGG